MSQHAELIARLLALHLPDDTAKQSIFKEAADALQTMERKPMTDAEALAIFSRTVAKDEISRRLKVVRNVEAFHGIQPPNVKGE